MTDTICHLFCTALALGTSIHNNPVKVGLVTIQKIIFTVRHGIMSVKKDLFMFKQLCELSYKLKTAYPSLPLTLKRGRWELLIINANCMKKFINRLLIILLLLLSVFGLYYYGYFTRYNYLTAKLDICNNNFRYICIGFPEYFIETEKLNKKYKMQMEYIEATIFVNTFTQGLSIYNRQMTRAMRNRLGEFKYQKYLHELDSLNVELGKLVIPPVLLPVAVPRDSSSSE